MSSSSISHNQEQHGAGKSRQHSSQTPKLHSQPRSRQFIKRPRSSFETALTALGVVSVLVLIAIAATR